MAVPPSGETWDGGPSVVGESLFGATKVGVSSGELVVGTPTKTEEDGVSIVSLLDVLEVLSGVVLLCETVFLSEEGGVALLLELLILVGVPLGIVCELVSGESGGVGVSPIELVLLVDVPLGIVLLVVVPGESGGIGVDVAVPPFALVLLVDVPLGMVVLSCELVPGEP